MALIKFGSLVTEGSGSLGGHTLQHSKGGMQLRTKPIPRGRPSAEQYAIRSINPVLQAGWRALTDAQRKIWNDYAQDYGIMNAKGDKHPLSGHSLWMKYNFSWIQTGGGFLPDPSYWGGPILGPELVSNGDFHDSSNWYGISFVTISSGKAHFSDLGTGSMRENLPITAGDSFLYRFEVSNASTFAEIFSCNQLIQSLFLPPYSGYKSCPNGFYNWTVISAVNSSLLRYFFSPVGSSFSIDNISLRKII